MTPSPDDLLTRVDVAAALTEAGFKVAPTSLATYVTRGGGPPYYRFGGRTLYRWGEAISWGKTSVGEIRVHQKSTQGTILDAAFVGF